MVAPPTPYSHDEPMRTRLRSYTPTPEHVYVRTFALMCSVCGRGDMQLCSYAARMCLYACMLVCLYACMLACTLDCARPRVPHVRMRMRNCMCTCTYECAFAFAFAFACARVGAHVHLYVRSASGSRAIRLRSACDPPAIRLRSACNHFDVFTGVTVRV